MRSLRHAAFVLLAVGSAASLSRAEQIEGREIEFARYAKAYVGSDNISVEVAPFKYQGSYKRGGIVIIRGIEGELDGKAVVNQYLESSDGWEYSWMEGDKKHYTLRMQKLPKEDRIQLFYPGNMQERFVVPSDGSAAQLSPRAIFDEYTKQQKTR